MTLIFQKAWIITLRRVPFLFQEAHPHDPNQIRKALLKKKKKERLSYISEPLSPQFTFMLSTHSLNLTFIPLGLCITRGLHLRPEGPPLSVPDTVCYC